MHHKGKLNSTFASHEAHDIRCKIKTKDNEMLPMFRVAQKQSMVGLFKSWVPNTRTAKFQLLQHTIASIPYVSWCIFVPFSSTQVPL